MPGHRDLGRDPRRPTCSARRGAAAAAASSAPRSRRWACSAPPAYILAMDTFGPITDNAGGIVEMCAAARGDPQEDRPPRLRRQHDQGADQGLRDRLGGARGVPALLGLPRRGQATTAPSRSDGVDLAKPEVFVGALLGAMLVFFFSALAIQAVGRAAQSVIEDVRAQFTRASPGIMNGHRRSPTTRGASTSSRAARCRQMVAARPRRRRHADRGRPRLQAVRHARRAGSAPRPSPAS